MGRAQFTAVAAAAAFGLATAIIAAQAPGAPPAGQAPVSRQPAQNPPPAPRRSRRSPGSGPRRIADPGRARGNQRREWHDGHRDAV